VRAQSVLLILLSSPMLPFLPEEALPPVLPHPPSQTAAANPARCHLHPPPQACANKEAGVKEPTKKARQEM
jgi:hypothetical protein